MQLNSVIGKYLIIICYLYPKSVVVERVSVTVSLSYYLVHFVNRCYSCNFSYFSTLVIKLNATHLQLQLHSQNIHTKHYHKPPTINTLNTVYTLNSQLFTKILQMRLCSTNMIWSLYFKNKNSIRTI